MKKVVITIEFDEASYEALARIVASDEVAGSITAPEDYLLNEVLSGLEYDGFRWLRATSEVGDA